MLQWLVAHSDTSLGHLKTIIIIVLFSRCIHMLLHLDACLFHLFFHSLCHLLFNFAPSLTLALLIAFPLAMVSKAERSTTFPLVVLYHVG